ncbi:hypothetical protein [Methyloceanibacter sp.]|uniref:hypothetical protein n=1 Tax=Methyloceanibacter sp. TaxID=1965321 RepID=UPI002D4A566A|nr:hypothetical protein [Methyloceanibacter sp.]HZP08385.1 hypothetical protein [Methyloceanibacter sp.]
MSKIAPLPPRSKQQPTSVTPDDQRFDALMGGIKAFVSMLSLEQQERLLREMTEMIRPIPTTRAGEVLDMIARLLPERRNWTVSDLKQSVLKEGVTASAKEIYNAVGYLNRKGHIRRVGYGRYVVDGVEVVTADDLGGENSRHEDCYRENRG